MEVKKLENKENNTAEITVLVNKDEFDAALNTVYKKLKGSITVPGFRKGKAPRKIVESVYGSDIFYEEAAEEVAPGVCEFAIKDKELKTAATPRITAFNMTEEKEAEFTILVALYPEVTLKQYKGIEAVRREVYVDPKEVDAEIESLRNRNSSLTTVEREAVNGDTVVIDYEGFKEGVSFEGGKAENYSLELGSDRFIPGFELKCIGIKAGEERDIDLTFPEDYQSEELAGQAVVFKIKCHEVKERILPELDDEFAKDVSEFDTLEEYKKSIFDSIEKRKSDAVRNDFVEAVLDKLIDEENMSTDVPEPMVDDRTERLIAEYTNRLKRQGMELEMYLRIFGMEMEVFEASTRKTAEKQVRTELALKKVAEIEGIELTEEDKTKEYEILAKEYGVDLESVKTFFDVELFEDSCLLTKVADFVAENAVGLPEPEETPEDETETAETGASENAE